MKCKLCNDQIFEYKDLCDNCEYSLFMIDEIIESFFERDSSLINLNVLREFSWMYAGYPRFWGYYNSMVDAIFFFFEDFKKTFMTIDDILTLNYSQIENDVLIGILEKSRIVKRDASNKNKLNIGELIEIMNNEVFRPGIPMNSPESMQKIQEIFGILSIVLTKSLIDKFKMNEFNKSEDILPRKAISVFNSLTSIIMNNDEESPIERNHDHMIFIKSENRMNLHERTKIKILYEMMGLTPFSPGFTNIIDHYDPYQQKLAIKNNVALLLEWTRERMRLRKRERERER